ncbi:MAG: SprT-like domain-containing protein [Alphaproteobacteria bacterium]
MSHPQIIENERWRRLLGRWFDLWGCAGLDQRVTIAVNNRFQTTLGRYEHRDRRISIAAFLLEGPPALLEEILCHEAAHAAVAHLHPRRVKPHGAEWRALMRAAGYKARATMRVDDAGITLPRRRKAAWRHSCPVCKASRNAGRPVRQWRCARCLAKGLNGELLISRLESRP